MAKKVLTRDLLLQKEDLRVEKVELSEDAIVYVRQMTGRERDNFEKTLVKQVKRGGKTDYESTLEDFRAKLAVSTICDENGDLILKMEDYPTLSKNMSAARLEKIINTAQKLNKISDEDKEDLVKNSGGDQAADSNSD